MKVPIRKRIPQREMPWRQWDLWDRECGGISQSFMYVWLRNKEEARLTHCEGWEPIRVKLDAIEFGKMSHYVLERTYAVNRRSRKMPGRQTVNRFVEDYEHKNRKRVVTQGGMTPETWETLLGVCEITMIEYMKHYPKDCELEWLRPEESFLIPYDYPDGERTWINGTRDGVFTRTYRTIAGKKSWYVWDTKTSGSVGELGDDLDINFQFNLYMHSVVEELNIRPSGLVMNVIRRSGKKVKQKNHSLKQMLDELRKDIQKRPEYYFMRPEFAMTAADLYEWRSKQLKPIMADLRLWWEGPGTWYTQANGYLDAPRSPRYVNPAGLEVMRRKVDLFPALVRGDFSSLKQRRLGE